MQEPGLHCPRRAQRTLERLTGPGSIDQEGSGREVIGALA
jgi:hypothetical protein